MIEYRYASKHYLIGFILFLFVSMSGAYAIRMAIELFPFIYYGYVGICCFMLYGYLGEYFKYKNRFVILHHQGMIIGDRKKLTYLYKKEIDCIIEANHRQRLKIHNIVHVFLIDGRYLFFDNQIAKYEKFKETLALFYEGQFYVRKSLFDESKSVTKEHLLNE